MNGVIIWHGSEVPFDAGESVAQALHRAGILNFGTGPLGTSHGVFCGFGQCQNCVIAIDGLGLREACLTLCKPGLVARAAGAAHD